MINNILEETANTNGRITTHFSFILYRLRCFQQLRYCFNRVCHILVSYCMNVCPRSSLWLYFPLWGECLEIFERIG